MRQLVHVFVKAALVNETASDLLDRTLERSSYPIQTAQLEEDCDKALAYSNVGLGLLHQRLHTAKTAGRGAGTSQSSGASCLPSSSPISIRKCECSQGPGVPIILSCGFLAVWKFNK